MKGHGSRSSELNGPLAKYLLSVFARMVMNDVCLGCAELEQLTGVVPILHKVRKVLVCVSPTKSFGWSSFFGSSPRLVFGYIKTYFSDSGINSNR